MLWVLNGDTGNYVLLLWKADIQVQVILEAAHTSFTFLSLRLSMF